MQQRRRRPSGHAAVTVGSAGDHAFEEAKNAAHAGRTVEGRAEMHLAGTWIGEAELHARGEQRAYQALCAVHVTTWLP